MAHDLYRADAMLYIMADGVPWHGLGVPLAEPVPATEALRIIKGDIPVTTEPIFLADGKPVEGFRATVGAVTETGPDGAPQVKRYTYGVVSDRYEPIQNKDAVSMWDTITDRLSLRTAGILRNGDTIWFLGEIDANKRFFLAGDQTMRYILLTNSHTGGSACRMFFTPVRVVCQNTLTAAMGGRGSADGIWIPHKGNTGDKVNAARDALGMAVRLYDGLAREADRLAAFRPSPETVENMLDIVAPLDEADRQDPASYRRKARERIAYLADFGAGQRERPDIRGTGWGWWNAVTDWTDHERRGTGPSADKGRRFESAIWGTGARIKGKVFDFLTDRAPPLPTVIPVGAAN